MKSVRTYRKCWWNFNSGRTVSSTKRMENCLLKIPWTLYFVNMQLTYFLKIICF